MIRWKESHWRKGSEIWNDVGIYISLSRPRRLAHTGETCSTALIENWPDTFAIV